MWLRDRRGWFKRNSRKDQCSKKQMEDEQCRGKCIDYCSAEGGRHFKHKCTEQPSAEEHTWPEKTTVTVNKEALGCGETADWKKKPHERFRILLGGGGPFIFSLICLTCRWSCNGLVSKTGENKGQWKVISNNSHPLSLLVIKQYDQRSRRRFCKLSHCQKCYSLWGFLCVCVCVCHMSAYITVFSCWGQQLCLSGLRNVGYKQLIRAETAYTMRSSHILNFQTHTIEPLHSATLHTDRGLAQSNTTTKTRLFSSIFVLILH